MQRSPCLFLLSSPWDRAPLVKLTRSVIRYYQKRPALSRTLLTESLFAHPPWTQKFRAQVAMVHSSSACCSST